MRLYLATLIFASVPVIFSIITSFIKRKPAKSLRFYVLSLVPFFFSFMATYYRAKWVHGELEVDAPTMWPGFFVYFETLAVSVIAAAAILLLALYIHVCISKKHIQRTSKKGLPHTY